jgi:hypothetical protein
LNIYIYGANSFKKQISKVLDTVSIKQRLNKTSSINTLNALELLKEAILLNPKDIFLIDHDKIIYNNILTNNIKLLNPKDGIEKDFLEENGIGDISIDDISDISKHIIKKLDFINNKENVLDIEEIEKIDDTRDIEVDFIAQNNKQPTQDKGKSMEQLTQLDDISEADMLDALSHVDGINVNIKTQTIEVDSSNLDDIATLLEQLKNNKTLEISIKIKD